MSSYSLRSYRAPCFPPHIKDAHSRFHLLKDLRSYLLDSVRFAYVGVVLVLVPSGAQIIHPAFITAIAAQIVHNRGSLFLQFPDWNTKCQ